MVIASVEPLPNSVISCLSHTASCAMLAKAIYLALAVDSATDDCSLLLQLSLRLSRRRNSRTSAWCIYSMPKSIVPFRYRITHFMAIQWCLDGLAENLQRM